MKVLSPIRDSEPGEPVPAAGRARQTGGMPIRYGVQADTRDECVEGLARLVDVGMMPIMMPTLLSDGRWMARAAPSPAPLREPVEG